MVVYGEASRQTSSRCGTRTGSPCAKFKAMRFLSSVSICAKSACVSLLESCTFRASVSGARVPWIWFAHDFKYLKFVYYNQLIDKKNKNGRYLTSQEARKRTGKALQFLKPSHSCRKEKPPTPSFNIFNFAIVNMM